MGPLFFRAENSASPAGHNATATTGFNGAALFQSGEPAASIAPASKVVACFNGAALFQSGEPGAVDRQVI